MTQKRLPDLKVRDCTVFGLMIWGYDLGNVRWPLKLIVCGICIFVAALFPLTKTVAENGPSEDLTRAREEMWSLREDIEKIQFHVRIEDLENSSPLQREIVKIFVEYWPVHVEVMQIQQSRAWLDLYGNRNLFKNAAERKGISKEIQMATKRLGEIASSKTYRSSIARMYNLCRKQAGSLCAWIRTLYHEEVRMGPGPKARELLYRIEHVLNEIAEIEKSYSVEEAQKTLDVALERLKPQIEKKKITIRNYQKTFGANLNLEPWVQGNFLVRKARKLLAEQAILKSEFAISMGYASWAHYSIARKSENYAQGFGSLKDRESFLRETLAKTRSAHESVVQTFPGVSRLMDAGSIFEGVVEALKPRFDKRADSYFPKNVIPSMWKDAMLSLGFDSQDLDTVRFDNETRDGKYSSAFAVSLVDAFPKTLVIRASTLNTIGPRNPEGWHKSQGFVVQNLVMGGFDEVVTAFHEGGHALENIYKKNLGLDVSDSAFVESHSKFMEHLLYSDPVFLAEWARNRRAQPIPASLAEALLQTKFVESLIELRFDVFRSLFEIQLWKEPFLPGGEDFVDRVRRLYKELWTEFFFGSFLDAPDFHSGDRMLFHSHFFQDDLDYIGYVYGSLAGRMVLDRIKQKIMTTNGGKTLFNQPLVAKLLIPLYRRGSRQRFPSNIEAFTERRFRVSALSDYLNEGLMFYAEQNTFARSATCQDVF